MPIYDQSYRSYTGSAKRRFRWLIMIEQEFRILFKSRIFFLLQLAGALHICLRVFQLVAWDMVRQDPLNPISPFIGKIDVLVVDAQMFFDFVRLQTPIVFMSVLFAGSGMIANDFRNNLMEIYFSKPMSWRDYVLGKVSTLTLVGLLQTGIPAVLMVMMHIIFIPTWEEFQNSWWWAPASFGFALVIVLPTVLGILASSAVFMSQSFGAIAVFMLLIANSTMGVIIAELLRDREYLIIAFPAVLNRIGQHLFEQDNLLYESNWLYSLGLVGAVCAVSLLLVSLRVRRAEVAA